MIVAMIVSLRSYRRSPTCEESTIISFSLSCRIRLSDPVLDRQLRACPKRYAVEIGLHGQMTPKGPVSPNALWQCQLFRIATCVCVETKELSYTGVHRRLGMLTAVEQWSRSALHKHKSSSSELCLKQPWLASRQSGSYSFARISTKASRQPQPLKGFGRFQPMPCAARRLSRKTPQQWKVIFN